MVTNNNNNNNNRNNDTDYNCNNYSNNLEGLTQKPHGSHILWAPRMTT